MTSMLAARGAVPITPPRTPKLLFFDIDGTVVNAAGVVTPASVAAFHRLREAGIRIAIASGRAEFTCGELIDQLGVNAPSVYMAGGLVSDPVTGETLYEGRLSPMELEIVLSAFEGTGIVLELFGKDRHFIEGPNPYSTLHAKYYLKQEPVIASFREIVENEHILKVQFIGEWALHEQILRTRLAELAPLPSGIASGAAHPGLFFASLTATAATKEHAFDIVTERLHISAAEVVAIGDGENDVPFIKRAGVGIAMGNARDTVKAAADLVVASVEEEGVSEAVDRLLAGISRAL